MLQKTLCNQMRHIRLHREILDRINHVMQAEAYFTPSESIFAISKSKSLLSLAGKSFESEKLAA